MSDVTVTVKIPDALRKTLADLLGAKRAVTEGAAMGIEAALRDHFQELQGRPRRDGLQPTGFWYGGKNSVVKNIGDHVIHDDGHASVTVDDDRLAYKLSGGTLKASDYGKKYLTIPANDEAAQADKGAWSFDTEIEWVADEDGVVRPALVASGNYVKTSRSRKTGEIRRKYQADSAKANAGIGDVLFWLVRKVTHKPMPGALPDGQTLGDAARDAALDALDALMKGAA